MARTSPASVDLTPALLTTVSLTPCHCAAAFADGFIPEIDANRTFCSTKQTCVASQNVVVPVTDILPVDDTPYVSGPIFPFNTVGDRPLVNSCLASEGTAASRQQ